jgi:hypothetical protein
VITRTYTGLQAIVLDLPPVTEAANKDIVANQATERVTTLPGDFTRTAFPRDVDVAVMASDLPQRAPDLIRLMIGNAFDVLVPGGQIRFVGELLHDDRRGPLSAALWNLNEAVYGLAVHPFVLGVLSRLVRRKPS